MLSLLFCSSNVVDLIVLCQNFADVQVLLYLEGLVHFDIRVFVIDSERRPSLHTVDLVQEFVSEEL